MRVRNTIMQEIDLALILSPSTATVVEVLISKHMPYINRLFQLFSFVLKESVFRMVHF